jgi:hypothetical protein
MLVADIKTYLNEVGETGIRIDKDTVITITDHERNVSAGPKKYREKVKEILIENGIYKDNLENEIVDAKIDHQVPEQKLKLTTKKKK